MWLVGRGRLRASTSPTPRVIMGRTAREQMSVSRMAAQRGQPDGLAIVLYSVK